MPRRAASARLGVGMTMFDPFRDVGTHPAGATPPSGDRLAAAVEPTAATAPSGPTADFWALLDDLAALGRALRLQGEAGSARPESVAEGQGGESG